ncbi:MAG: AI-2E family transporter [Methylomonas lenta]|nr:AI-2E family transporter [Methylomonas lenta]
MTMPITRFEKAASLGALFLLLFACYQVLRPFLFDILWAAILCFVTWPMYSRLRDLPLSSNRAAACMVLPIGVLILTPFVAAALSIPDDVHRILQWLTNNSHTWPAAPDWLKDIPVVGDMAVASWQSFGEDSGHILELARKYALSTSSWVLKQGIALAGELVHMGFSLLVLFFFYRDGEEASAHLVSVMQLLAGEQTQRILQIVRTTLRAVVYGILGTALAQAIVSILGFLIAGVPYAFALGFAAFFLMIIPTAGTIVWLPVSIWLLFEGETLWAIFIALWFLLLVGTIDNWLRPMLISREVELPFVLILFGILGGLLAFGFIGVFIGPTLLATSYALMLDWLIRKERDTLGSVVDKSTPD